MHKVLDLPDNQPKSMLQSRETRVERARYPVIDTTPTLRGEQGSQRRVHIR
jgi:hypothetical protein